MGEVLSSDKEPQATRDKMVCLRLILLLSLLSLCLASQGRPGSCETSRCRHHSVTAAVCCLSGQNSRCCDYIGGGGEVLRRLPGTTEGLATTRAIITTRGDVSGTPSVPGLSSVAICTGDTSAPRLNTGDK